MARPPGPEGAARLLMLPLLARDTLRFFADMPRWYGPVVMVPVGRERLIIITDPALIREVLVERGRQMHKDRLTRSLSVTLGEGLLTSEDEVWRRSRRKIAPSFQRDELEGYAAVMARHAAQWVRARQAAAGEGEAVELLSEMSGLTLQIVAETLFGAANIGRVAVISEALEGLMALFARKLRSWRRLVPDALLVNTRREFTAHNETIDRTLREIIAQRTAPAGRRDLLARLQEARDEDGAGFTDQQLRDEAITLFLAGHETTALGLTFALWLLARHPAAADRLREEVRATLADDEAPAMASVSAMPYLQATLRETMRLYPPAWGVLRTVTEPITLGGYDILPGDSLIMMQWLMHRSPEWYDEPEAFRPERWLDGRLSRLPQFAYFPFGGGPRTCVGSHFALMEMGVVLAAIARELSWTVSAPEPLPLLPSVTLRPDAPISARFFPAP